VVEVKLGEIDGEVEVIGKAEVVFPLEGLGWVESES